MNARAVVEGVLGRGAARPAVKLSKEEKVAVDYAVEILVRTRTKRGEVLSPKDVEAIRATVTHLMRHDADVRAHFKLPPLGGPDDLAFSEACAPLPSRRSGNGC